MKRAVKWSLTSVDGKVQYGQHQPVKKEQDGRRQPRKVQWPQCPPLMVNVDNDHLQNSRMVDVYHPHQWLPFSRSTAGSPFQHARN